MVHTYAGTLPNGQDVLLDVYDDGIAELRVRDADATGRWAAPVTLTRQPVAEVIA